MSVIKGTAKLKRILFPKGVSSSKGGFTIASFEPIKIDEGDIELNSTYGTFTIKGDLPSLDPRTEYYFNIEEESRHAQFGVSYKPLFMRQDIKLDKADKKSVEAFLRTFLTARQVQSLFEEFEDPMVVIDKAEIEKLTKAKGIGIRTAEKIVSKYDEQKDYSHAYIELAKYDISPEVIRKICKIYGSPELAVQRVLENPYDLKSYDGYGFKKCDEIYIKTGGDRNAPIRIDAFLSHFLQEEADKGNTWSSPVDVLNATFEYIPNADKNLVGEILLKNPDKYLLSADKKRVSLLWYVKLELEVAQELTRINRSTYKFRYSNWETMVARMEKEQGWEFTDEQKYEAMVMMFENNVSLLQGYGGTGKTTILKAVVDILESYGYIYAQCALSGKASNNLAIVTGKNGSTIHRLLAYNHELKDFSYNKKNPLPYDIIVVDEISMVDAKIFASLLRAIRTGAKLIMLGDSQQLESIGIPIMVPMIQSGLIVTKTLTQIHRQAQKSAVVTDSIAIRQGKNPIKDASGRVIRGELQDLEYLLVDEDEEIFVNVVKEFYKHIQKEDIKDVQILTQVRNRGNNSCLSLNRACQKIYNPADETRKQVELGNKEKNTDYILREGDKVINVKNNYKAETEDGFICPVFNGSIGILEYFSEDDEGKFALIDFEGIGRLKIYEDSLRSVELAYCITVHKSQGSSSKIVIVAFPYHYLLNNRQIIYTAITRTRVHCVVISTKDTLRLAIKKDEVAKKRTYLSDLLVQIDIVEEAKLKNKQSKSIAT